MAKTQAEVRAAKDAKLAKRGYNTNKSASTPTTTKTTNKTIIEAPVVRPTSQAEVRANKDAAIAKYGYTKERSFGKNTYDSEAYDVARNNFMDWMLNTGSSGGANNKNYGYDWSDPEDVERFNNRQISKKYEASYSSNPYDQWLKANGQASMDFFDDKYYAKAYSSVMADRAQKQAVQDFKKAVGRELVTTANDAEHPTNDEIAEAVLRIQKTDPRFASIEIVNPKNTEPNYDNYFSPVLAQQEAEQANIEKRSNALYLDDVSDYYYALWDAADRKARAAQPELDPQAKMEKDVYEAERRADINRLGNQILGLDYTKESGQRVKVVSQTPLSIIIDKAQAIANMGTAAREGFSPISMSAEWQAEHQLSDAERVVLDAAMATTTQQLIAQGYSENEVHNYFRRADLGEYIDPEDAMRVALTASGMDAADVQAALDSYTDEDWANAQRVALDLAAIEGVENSTIDQLGYSVISMPVTAAFKTAASFANLADMIGGDPDWGFVEAMNEKAARWEAIGHDSNHKALSTMSEVGSEIFRILAISKLGALAGGVSAATSGMSWFVSQAAQSLPFVASAMGSYYGEAKAGGADHKQATKYALIAGTVEGILEKLAIGDVMQTHLGSKMFSKKLVNGTGISKEIFAKYGLPLADILVSSVGEGIEESLSYVASGLARRGSWDNNYKMSWDEAGENFMGGLLIGGIMSGLAAPADSQRYKYATKMLEQTGTYTTDLDSLYAASYFETLPAEQQRVLTEQYNNGEIIADKATRKEATKAERELDAINREVAAKKEVISATEKDARNKREQADNKVENIKQRIATLQETDHIKKAKAIKDLSGRLEAANKARSELYSETEKKLKTAQSEYAAVVDKKTSKASDLEETIAKYQAAKYYDDFYGKTAPTAINATSASQTVEPTTNSTETTNAPQNLIDTVKTDAVEVAEPVVAETVEVPTETAIEADTVVAEQGVFNESRVSSNTLTKKFGEEAIKTFKDLDPDFGTYEVVSEETTMRNAENWINSDGMDKVEYELLDDKRKWDGTDVDAAMMLLTQKMSDGAEGGIDALLIAEKMQEQGTEGGQLIQSFAKWSRTPAGMAVEAVKQTKKTQKKILDGNAATRKSVEADRKAVKEATKKAKNDAAKKVANTIKQRISSDSEIDPVEVLARKVVKAAQPRTATEATFVDKMIRDLFGVASSSPITPVDNRPDKTMSDIGLAYSNAGEYKRVWEEAERAVVELMGNTPEVINALNAYRINTNRTIIPEATLKKAYNKAAEAVGLDMSKLIKKQSGNVEAMRNEIINYLVSNTGVSEEGAVALAMEVNHIFNRGNAKATARYLNAQLGEKSNIKKAAKSALDDIEGVVNAGALIDIAYADVIVERLEPKFRKILKDSGYSIGDILAYGAGKEDIELRKFFGEVLRADVSFEDLASISEMAERIYRDVVAEEKQAYLNKQFADKSARANPEEALKTVTKLVNAGVLTNTEVADKVESKLDSKFRKALKEQGIDVKSIILQGTESVEDAANAFVAQADNLNIGDTEKQQIKDAMYDTFNDVVAEVKDKYAQTLIKKYEAKQNPDEKQQPMNTIQKALYNAAMGVYSDKRIDDAILEANGLPVVTEEDIAYIKANMEKALEARRVMEAEGKDALYEGEKADYQIRRYQEEAAKVIASKMSVDGRVKFRDFQRVMMLLNSKTLIKNTAANVPMGVLENIKDNPAALVDILASKITGKRTTQGTTLNKIKAQAEGLKKGVTETIKDYKYGVNTTNANMLGRYSAFEDGDVINRTTNAKPRVWNDNTLVGKVLNGADKLLSTGMALGDRPFFEAAVASRAAELEALGYDVNSDESQMDIVRYALDRTFQNNSDAAQAFSNIRNGLNKLHIGDVGLGDLVMPFVQTPGNITDKLIDYSGVGGAARGIAQIIGAKKTGEFDQKLFVDRMGRSMTGFGMMALGYALAKCGALVLGARDDEERQAMNNAGVKEFSITIDGETYHTIDWADPTANLLFIGGAISEMGFEGATMGQIVETSIGTAVNSIFQMSVLQNLATLFGGSEDDVWRNLGGTAENFPTQFVWSTINAVARTADAYERETYSPDRLQQMANKIMAKIPVLRERLPIKLNTAGQEVESYRGDTAVERFIQSFINPGYTTEATDDVVHSELWRLHESGGFDVQYLPKAYKTVNGVKLTTEQYQEYQRILGNATYSAALDTIKSAKYKQATDKEKADMLDKAISKAISSKEVKDFKNSLKD